MREAVYDPAFFARSAEILSARGLVVASLDQRSAPMREAWSQFYEAVNAGALAHEGDAILTAHVLNAAAHVDPSGHWKVRKIKQSHKIDGLVASVIAYSRAARVTGSERVLGALALALAEGMDASPAYAKGKLPESCARSSPSSQGRTLAREPQPA